MDEGSRSTTPPSNSRPRHPAVITALAATMQEFSWNHPRLRVCCGAFGDGDQMCVLEVSESTSLRPLTQTHAEGDPVRAYREAIDFSRAGLFAADIDNDDVLRRIPRLILGEDTRATHVIALHSAGETIGFMRLDAASAEDLDQKVVEALETTVPTGLAAAALEREHARAQVTANLLERLEEQASERRSLFRQAASQLRSSSPTLTPEEALERLLVLLATLADQDTPHSVAMASSSAAASVMPPRCAPAMADTH